MRNRTFGLAEVVGTSPDSIESAVSSAVERAGKTMRHIDWFEVTQVRGYVKDGVVDHFQVSLKVGYRLEDV